jgi:predicted Zn finger-like uncharacterized protein
MPAVNHAFCPRCHARLRISADWIGRSVRCKQCQKSFRAAAEPSVAEGPEPTTKAAANPFAFREPDGPGELELIPAVPALNQTRRRAKGLQWVVLIAAFVTALATGAGFYFHGTTADDGRHSTLEQNANSTTSPAPPPFDLPKAADSFPRRFLAVCVHDYLYANPVSARGERNPMPEQLRSFARDQLRTPSDQIYVLSDAANRDPRPPIKPMIEQTVERFLETCRRQDRIVLVFVGHAVEFDDGPYLVPLEGELTAKGSLISLRWLYDRLTGCSAREKLLIMDVCRTDTARGNERPGSGPMGVKLDTALAGPPTGVEVVTACMAGQFSHEYDYAVAGAHDVHGSAFMSLLTRASRSGWGIPKPEDALPGKLLVERIAAPLSDLVSMRDKAQQTARLAGAIAAADGEYDPAESSAAHLTIPRVADLAPGGLADARQVRSILAEIALPPIKPIRNGQEAGQDEIGRLAEIIPFRADALKGYEADYQNLRELLDQPERFPLRVAVIHAVEALDKLARSGRGKLMDEFRGPATDDVKKSITDNQKEGPARLELELATALEELEKAADLRDSEKSRRWLAHFDYVMAQVKARKAYVAEYNLMLGKAKRDELPPLDPKLHNGFRLASQEKLQSGKEIKDLASESRKLLTKLIKDNPGTPWELLAKRERFTALGLTWQPANLGQ